MIQRFYFQEIKSRVDEPRKFIQVIYGPRQVGKTTLIKQVLSNITQPYIFETADDILGVDAMWLRKIWSDARLQYSQHKQELLLVIDEVQKIENWSEVIKKEWDLDTFNDVPIKLVILGSSSLLIQKGLSESLAGRFESIYIPHWSYKEMKEAFGWSIDEYIWFGGYPGAASLINDEERWKRYVKNSLIEASISKDILMLTRVDKPVLLHRLFEIGCSYSSQILSLTKIQGELMERGNITTLSNYLKMLDTAGLLCGIDKYACDIIRKRASKPKFQVYNNALLSAQSELNFREAKDNPKLWGRIFESVVGTHLLNHSKVNDYKLYYWNENSQEVDFVIQKGSKVVAIEVKSGKDSTNKGMSIFNEKYRPTSLFTIGTDGISIEDFLEMKPTELFV